MFGKKRLVVSRYAKGEIKDITEVNDQMFSQKMLGDGCYIIPSEKVTEVTSPIKGKITMIFDTKHAIGIKNKEGIECLLHYGIDTVNLKGEGFKINVKVGDKVDSDKVIMKVDNEIITNAGFATSIIAVFTDLNGYQLKKDLQSDEIFEFIK